MSKSTLNDNTNQKKIGRPVTTGKGELIGVRLHEPALGELDAWIAAQPEPRPSRPEAIRRLVAESLVTAPPEKTPVAVAPSPFGPRDSAFSRQEIVDTLKRVIDAHARLAIFAPHLKLALRERLWEHDRVFPGGTRQGPVSLHVFIHENYPVGIGASYEIVESLISGDAEALAMWNEAKAANGSGEAGVRMRKAAK